MDVKIIFGSISVLIAFLAYVNYFYKWRTAGIRPHAYSWLVWSVLGFIAFFSQIVYEGGAGSWVTGFTSALAFVIFFLALKYGEKEITLSDKLSLFFSGIALIFWYLTSTPLFSLILVVLIDALGFYPTFRKSYFKPYEETIFTYNLSSLKFFISIFALDSYSPITLIYPVYLVVINSIFVTYVLIRRNVKILK